MPRWRAPRPGPNPRGKAEGYRYAIRLKANAVLERHIAHLLKRPVGRPSKKPKVFYHAFRSKVEWHAGELFPRVGFVVTNPRRSPKRVIKFSNGRGAAEQWIKEGKNALNWTRLSCRRFKDDQVRLQLFALAYNLANFLRQLALPRSVQTWSLTTLRENWTMTPEDFLIPLRRHGPDPGITPTPQSRPRGRALP